MNNYNKMIGATLMLISAAIAMPAQSAEQPLSATELGTMMSDIDVAFSGKGFTGVMKYRANGSVSTELTFGFSDQGEWWLEENQICTKWQRMRSGRTACFFIYRAEGENFRTSTGYTIHAL